MRNPELAEKVMQKILDDPDSHKQALWLCGTTGCYAGHVALELGYSAAVQPRPQSFEAFSSWVMAGARCHKDGQPYVVSQVATEALDLSSSEAVNLFRGTNTIPVLQAMIKDYVNGEPIRSAAFYELAAGEVQ